MPAPVAEAEDLKLVSGVSRSAAGTSFEDLGTPIFRSIAVAHAAEETDVVVDYTAASAVKDNVLAAVGAGASVVVGSSGLSAEEL